MKTCTKCKIEKTKSYEYFSVHKQSKDGFNNWCRECLKEDSRNRPKKKKTIENNYQLTKEWRKEIKGVYGIFENGECLYVGESSQVNQRLSVHRYLTKNPDKSKGMKHLYEQLINHPSRVFGIIEQCENHKDRERYFIDMYNPMYNI